MSTPGRSGDPESPFYDTLVEKSVEDESFSLVYSREKVQQNTAKRIDLVPDQGRGTGHGD